MEEVVYVGANRENHVIVDSMSFPLKTLDEACDLLKQFRWDSYEFENFRENLGRLANCPPVFHANSYSYDPVSYTHLTLPTNREV